ncbi:ribonucleotide reductase [Microbacterium phage Pumpernickel]|uniref:ribonucleoside-diphosphate reductase n=1 Tax=Microbacterium phage Pumpernickel TaxID=2885983 RepID=A0AAE8YBK4_9CAUD|nr:ribonucleotide reductase [Microbacterium phage Pumpernickel]UDL15944.1 ribonucleotide reductase [Microbacterium phage Pumpernickel]
MRDNENLVLPINWNEVPEFENQIWQTLTTNFWVPERVNMSGDLASWRRLTDAEQELVLRVFAGLTLLDTIQGTVGAVKLLQDAKNPFQEAILSNIVFMEQVHAKSYSNIFSTLANTERINDAFRWSRENEFLIKKQKMILEAYDGDDPLKRAIASVFLESGLFFSGFGLPFYMAGRGKLPNTADMIRLILRDEAIHGYAIGYWFQRDLPEDKVEEYKNWALDFALELYANEEKYTRSLYDEAGLTSTILPYVRYNFSKAFQNLGFDPLFPDTISDIDPVLASSMSQQENGDFFSGTTTYAIGKTEDVDGEIDDWEF